MEEPGPALEQGVHQLVSVGIILERLRLRELWGTLAVYQEIPLSCFCYSRQRLGSEDKRG